MDQPASPRPKLAKTVVDPTVKLREVTIGVCCEVLGDTAIEYAGIGDYSYLGPGCMVADAEIGKFCAIAAQVRIGAPNHPLDRPSQHRFDERKCQHSGKCWYSDKLPDVKLRRLGK